MLDPARLDAAIDGLYCAGAANDGWPAALDGLARAVDAVGCRIHPRQRGGALELAPASPGYASFLEEFVRDDWWRTDHRAARGWPRLAGGRKVLIDHDVASDAERQSLPQYRDLYRRHDVPWWAAVSFEAEGRLWAIPFLRSASQGPFTRAEAESLRKLAPHLERVHRLARLASDTSAVSVLAAFDRMAQAAALVDAGRQVIRHNAAFDALLGSGLILSNRRLSATDRQCAARLQDLVEAAARSSSASRFEAEPVPIRRPGLPPVMAEVFPASGLIPVAFGQARALLLFTDLAQPVAPGEATLRAMFGLSRSEARLGAMMVRGLGLPEIAARYGLSIATLRTQLKAVYVKTGTRRQAELVALLSRCGRPVGDAPHR